MPTRQTYNSIFALPKPLLPYTHTPLNTYTPTFVTIGKIYINHLAV